MKTDNTNKNNSGAFSAALMLMLLVFGSVTVNAEAEVEVTKQIAPVRSGIPHDAIYAMAIQGDHGYAIGNFGLMLETHDSGASWEVLPAPVPTAMLGIALAGEHRIVVGQSGLVMVAKGDETWRTVDAGVDIRLLNVALSESGKALMVGEFGQFFRSDDFGETWEPLMIDWMQYNEDGYEPHLYDAHIATNGDLFISGEFGLILKSTDGGDSWVARNQGDPTVFDMHFAGDGSGFAVGQEGYVLRTADGGESWQQVDVASGANLLGVWSSPHGEVVICGMRELIRSSDGGNSWTPATDLQVIRTWYQAIATGVSQTASGQGVLNAEKVYIAGHSGTIAEVLF